MTGKGKFKILAVDDEEVNLKLFGEWLKECDYEFQSAKNGFDALEKVKAFQPDVILLDIMMPGMDGYEVCRRLKADPQTRTVPVVMITGLADEASKLKGLEAGASDFLNKPVYPTELTARVRNLLDLKESIQRTDQVKNEFLANMSHELRTPLNAIIGFSEMLNDGLLGELNSRQAESVKDILNSGRHLLSLINDILDLSKVEAGEMKLHPSEVSLKSLLETGLMMVRQKALKHGITLSLDMEEGVDLLEADERKVKQILFNLLSNAVKFTPDGGRVGVEAHRQGEEAVVTVWDTGIGIALQDQGLLFQPFRQIDGSRTRQYEGTGLGLAFTKKLVNLHGGDIRVESVVEKGSRFTFTLPLQRRSEETPLPVGENVLLSYDALCRHLERLINMAKRRRNELAVIRLKLREIRSGNLKDSLGTIIRGIQTRIRSYDVVGMVAEGEPALSLLLFNASRSQAREVASRCRGLLAEKGIETEEKVVVFPEDGKTAEELIKAVSP